MFSGHREKYGPLSGHNLAPAIPIAEPTPRRLGSLPSFLQFGNNGGQSNVLPLSRKDRTASAYAGGSPSLATSAKLSSRRLSSSLGLGSSSGLTKRFKLLIAGIVICVIIVISNSRTHPPARRLRTRAQLGHSQKTYKAGAGSNGLSLIDQEAGQDEESWLDEAEPWFSQYGDATEEDEDDWSNIDYSKMTAEEAQEKKEMVQHRIEVAERHRAESLRALTWYVAEGGELPSDWEVPTRKHINKIGGRGVEHILQTMDEKLREEEGGDAAGEEIFEEGWAEFAKNRYRTVVFSKTYCPFSKRAKDILENYHLTPAPFIIELDIRPDGPKIQALLEHLTSRRTVPNVLLDFVSIGGADDLTLMHAEGGLKRRFTEMLVLPGQSRAAAVAARERQGRQAVIQVPDADEAEQGAPAAQVADGVDAAEHGQDLGGEDEKEEQVSADADADVNTDADDAHDDVDIPGEAEAEQDVAAGKRHPRQAAKAKQAAAQKVVKSDDAEETEDSKGTQEDDAEGTSPGTAPAEEKKHRLDAFAQQHSGRDEEDEDFDESPAVERQRAQIAQRARQPRDAGDA